MRIIHPSQALALAAVVLLPACATRRYDVTAIGAVPKTAGRVDGQSAKLKLGGLEIGVEALDVVPLETAAPQAAPAPSVAPPLSVRLRLESKELGFAFDPSRVVLRRGSEEWHARLSSAPGSGCTDSGIVAGAGGGRLWLAPRSCLVLAFDVPVGEGDGHELVLDGLARGRRPLAPVVMPITRRRATTRVLTEGGKQALMVPVYILLAPLALAGGAY